MTSGDDENATPAMNMEAAPEAMEQEAQPAAALPDTAIEVVRMAVDVGPVVAATFVVPFVKSIATKAGEDCYQALRKLLPRHGEPAVPVSVADPDTGTKIVYTPPLPDDAIRLLAALKPKKISGTVVTWNPSTRTWDVRP